MDERRAHLLALIEECKRMQVDPRAPTVQKSALGVPAQLEWRLCAELEALD